MEHVEADSGLMKYANLPRLLRVIGTIVLLGAAGTFLFNEWRGLSDYGSYGTFLVFTALIAVAGIFCSKRLHDQHGARTLFALATAIIPVHYCQLGALVFSTVRGVDSLPRSFPESLMYHGGSGLIVAGTVIGATSVLAPVALLGFAALVRPVARQFAVLFMATNLMLLLPVRDAGLIGFLFLLVTLVYRDSYAQVATSSGVFSRRELSMAKVIAYSPVLALALRTLLLYPSPQLLGGLILVVSGFLLFQCIAATAKNAESGAIYQDMCLFPMLIGWAMIVNHLVDARSSLTPYLWSIAVLPIVCALVALSFARLSGGARYRYGAALLAPIAVTLQAAAQPGMPFAVLQIVIAIVSMSYFFCQRKRLGFAFATVIFCSSLRYPITHAWMLALVSPWLSLGIIGVGTIVAASYLERHGARLLSRLEVYRIPVGQ